MRDKKDPKIHDKKDPKDIYEMKWTFKKKNNKIIR